jgi:ppGpp synthetase/RelA/SpoT-type nucleotidyltranferase
MSLTSEVISDATERYNRERDRYLKLTRLVEDICHHEIKIKRSIQAQISSRTKHPASFEKKLYRFAKDHKKESWSKVDDIFDNMGDLAGVRISLYSQRDQQAVIAALNERFTGPSVATDGSDVKMFREEKDKHTNGSANFYRATHCQVYLQSHDMIGDNQNLLGLGCEIQVCSIMAHVWNEVEHDIGYKPTGKIGEDEEKYLVQLGKLIRKGDQIIDKLLGANEKRVKETLQSSESSDGLDVELSDELAVRRALCGILGIKRVTFNSASLYQELVRLNLTNYSKLKSTLGDQSDWELAKQEIRLFNTFLRKSGDIEFQLDSRNSTDPALWIILSKMHEEILEQFPAGRGQGRPRRIRSLALRYKYYIKHKDSKIKKEIPAFLISQGNHSV